MKKCPQCQRSYADETISFCLADGQLLSPSYDSAATLPLKPARATNGRATEILPIRLSPERARKIIRRNWIVGAIAVPAGAAIGLIQFATMPDNENRPIGLLIYAAISSAVLWAYFVWSGFWGYPAVWRWWRTFARKLFRFITNRVEFQGGVLILTIIAGLCLLGPALLLVILYFYSLFWVGFAYSVFGGGVYQFLQARKMAKREPVSES
jgi:hypothetical protein